MKWSCGRQHDVTVYVYDPRPDIDLCERLLRTSVYPFALTTSALHPKWASAVVWAAASLQDAIFVHPG